MTKQKRNQQKQLLSDRQFVIAIILVVMGVAFVYSLALVFSANQTAGNGEFSFQLSDIVGGLIVNGLRYAPYALFPAAFASFLYLSSKKSKNMRWPVALLSLGIFCLVVLPFINLFSVLF